MRKKEEGESEIKEETAGGGKGLRKSEMIIK